MDFTFRWWFLFLLLLNYLLSIDIDLSLLKNISSSSSEFIDYSFLFLVSTYWASHVNFFRIDGEICRNFLDFYEFKDILLETLDELSEEDFDLFELLEDYKHFLFKVCGFYNFCCYLLVKIICFFFNYWAAFSSS